MPALFFTHLLRKVSHRLVLIPSLIFGVCGCAATTELASRDMSVYNLGYVKEIKRFSSVAGLASVQVEMNGDNFKGTHALFAEAPNKLRADLLGLFGAPVYMLASDGRVITYFQPRDNRFFKNIASIDNFYRLTRIPLDSTDFVGLLLGRMPELENYEFHARIDDDANHVVTLTAADATRQRLLYNRNNRLISGELWRYDRLLLKVEYDEFTDEGFATRIRIEFPAILTRAVIEFDTPDVNTLIPAKRFELSLPEGAVPLEMDKG